MQGKTKVKVLIIGEVTKSFLRGTERNRGSCSLNVIPLFQGEVERLEELVRGFSSSSKGKCLVPSCPTIIDEYIVKAATSETANSGFMVSDSIGIVRHICPSLLRDN